MRQPISISENYLYLTSPLSSGAIGSMISRTILSCVGASLVRITTDTGIQQWQRAMIAAFSPPPSLLLRIPSFLFPPCHGQFCSLSCAEFSLLQKAHNPAAIPSTARVTKHKAGPVPKERKFSGRSSWYITTKAIAPALTCIFCFSLHKLFSGAQNLRSTCDDQLCQLRLLSRTGRTLQDLQPQNAHHLHWYASLHRQLHLLVVKTLFSFLRLTLT